MDDPEDNSYLTLLNDGTQNFLLQSHEEVLGVPDPTLNVEPIFRDIEDGATGWSVGLPILNLISEAEQPTNIPVDSMQKVKTINEEVPNINELYDEGSSPLSQEFISTENHQLYPIQIPGKGFITSDGVFVSNDLLIQLRVEQDFNNELPAQSILIDPKTLTPHLDDKATLHSYLATNGNVPIDSNTKSVAIETDKADSERTQAIESFTLSNGAIQLFNGDVINLNNHLNDETQVDENSTIYDELYEVVMAYKCKHCKHLCENQAEMIEHVKIGHLYEADTKIDIVHNGVCKTEQQTVFLCSECNVGYNSMDTLKQHMISVHQLIGAGSNLKEQASNNNNVENSQKSLLKPRNDKKPEEISKAKITVAFIKKQQRISKKIKCSMKGCYIRFARDEMRKRHEQCHVEGQKKQFKCTECGTKFSIWRVCSLHLWKCHKIDMGLLTCPMCHEFKTAAPINLFHHMAIHEDDRPYSCSQCKKTYKQATQLRNHQLSHKEPPNLPDWATQQQCDICKKFFANSKSLRKHIQCVHDKFKPFICHICGHKTARKSMLELHLRQHTGEKPHKCAICDYKTGDHNSLRRHLMRHSGVRKYFCPHCQYQCIQSTAYKKHIASKHPGLGGSYYCRVCPYNTVNENAYNTHVNNHKNGLIDPKNNRDPTTETNGGNEKVAPRTNQTYKHEDEETQSCFFVLANTDEPIDTGGITIPAGYELQVPF